MMFVNYNVVVAREATSLLKVPGNCLPPIEDVDDLGNLIHWFCTSRPEGREEECSSGMHRPDKFEFPQTGW